MSENQSKGQECSNQHPCTCHNTSCPRHGRCCDCVAYHKARGDLPVCLRGNT